MRRRTHVAALIFLGTMAVGSLGARCDSDEEVAAQALEAGSSGSSGTVGGRPDPPPQCVPGEGEGWKKADATCGVFVRLDADDENAGTPDAAVKSLGKAIALATALPDATKKNVYACAETFEEKVEIQADVTLFGGLDCENGWQWIGEQKRTTLTAEAGTIPLTMHGGGSVRMEDVHVLAESILTSGASSIAAVADGVTVSLARCTIEASDAAPGADQRQDSDKATGGSDGNPGEGGCMASITAGGAEQFNDCKDGGEVSISGVGGAGQPNSGSNGGDGTPGGSANGGAGQTAGGTLCLPGNAGADGMPGKPGTGGTALGSLAQGGYTGKAGDSGLPGAKAQGGGGGGGARGVPNTPNPGRSCPDPNAKGVGGPSGGSGGAGGCGGKGGPGGSAGGASIALISLDSTLQLHDVILKTGSGGKGGNGAPGQPGGTGGAGGEGGKALSGASNLGNACNGGRGGSGGQGGRGGGGRGGHSIGIAFRGTPPPMDANDLQFELGEPGLGGEGDGNEGDGAPGVKAPTLDFASP
ncbi:PGRS family protein [Sorangium sp. So ce124]|uniref:PGRS family protein n=1 Tax=Sorangium sp. So ce124 TaxID=3133280 RepID=UPI003F604742